MKNLDSETLLILQQFKTAVQGLYGSRFVKMILFGSYARGCANEFSDMDILILLTSMRSPYVETRRMSEIKFHFLEEYEKIISTIPTTLFRYEKSLVPLYRIIKNEGVEI